MAIANTARDWSPEDKHSMSLTVSKRPPMGALKGVTLYRRTGRWMAQIRTHGAYKCIGYFPTPEEAAMAYDKAAFEAWGFDCYLNFPDRIAA